ncbi:ABC transporter permease [Streptomyces sp. RFCAC02]|uniref:ABC transporter permease n=1 Tax=Streptomyces sp. RFCAC02 TaxID=2499143 RepID=UPI00101F5E4B|nr:ABC transporter permease [Streptomyces sp. RFCAC02]
MTDPEPAPDRDLSERPAHDPWAPPPPAGGPDAADGGGARPRRWVREVLGDLLVAVCAAVVTGVALGLLWLWLAPRIPLVSDGEAVLLADAEGQQAIGADGTFLLWGLGLGALTGVVVFLLRRRGGAGVVLALAIGTFLGSLLAWRLGMWLGPTDDIGRHARDVGQDVVFDAPLRLGAKGVLLGLPFGAVAVHMLCAAVWGPRDEVPREPELPSWGGPEGVRHDA